MTETNPQSEKQVFLYKKGTLNSTHLKMLKSNGFLPIPVESMANVKILQSYPEKDMSQGLLIASLKAIQKIGSCIEKAEVLDVMIKQLLEKSDD